MKESIKILFVEDVLEDAELVWREISKNNICFEKKLVETKNDYVESLKSFIPDLIISDFSLPQFDGMTALLLKNELTPEIPFILVTGSINEEIAVESMKAGADDYVIKQNLTRLGPAIIGAIKKKEVVRAKRKVEEALLLSEEIFNSFMEYCPVYFFFKDNEAKPVRLSCNFEKVLGRPASEAIGKSMYELFPHDMAKAMIEDDLNVIHNNVPIKIEEELDGRIFETIKFPIRMVGQQPYLAGFALDVTERKKGDEALKQKIEELERFNDLTIGRELKMIDLKKEVNMLLKRLHENEKYKIVE